MSYTKPLIIIFLSIIFIAISGFMIYFFYGLPWELFSYKDKFESYLEDKYEKDFAIDKISFDFLHGGTYHAYAYEKDNPNVTFHVGQSRYTQEIEDAYLYEKWRQQAKKEIGDIVEKFYPNTFNYAVEVLPKTNLSATESTRIPNYKKYTTIELDISKKDLLITEKNRDVEIEKTYYLLNSLLGKGITLSHFGVSYENRTLQLQPNEIASIKSKDDLDKMLIGYRQN